MKKLIVLFIFTLFALPVYSNTTEEFIKPIEGGVTFDWISKTQLQRDENINDIRDVLFSNNTTMKYTGKEFKEKFSSFLKNSNYLNDYDEIADGKKEDKDKYYCGFFWKKILFAYGVQYKNNLNNIYYYDALGNLKWIDIFSSDYPKFPYWSYQYNINGKLVAAYYYLSGYDQYVFTPDKKFKGRWYKENLYDRKAKIVMTRSSF